MTTPIECFEFRPITSVIDPTSDQTGLLLIDRLKAGKRFILPEFLREREELEFGSLPVASPRGKHYFAYYICKVDRDEDEAGRPAIRWMLNPAGGLPRVDYMLTTELLCPDCAADPELVHDDECLYVALSSEGEIESAQIDDLCSHCGVIAYGKYAGYSHIHPNIIADFLDLDGHDTISRG